MFDRCLFKLLLLGSIALPSLGHASQSNLPAVDEMPAVDSCQPIAGVQLICNVRNPEDFQQHPDGRHLVIANGLSIKPPRVRGSVSIYDSVTERVTRLQPRFEKTPGWGELECEQLSDGWDMHGMSVDQLADGRVRVLVINHAEHESIEFFELADIDSKAVLTWRGCVEAPSDGLLNDVAGHPDGGFVATVFGAIDAISSKEGHDILYSGENTGHVLRWNTSEGFKKLPGTESPGPNGVMLTEDGKTMFFVQHANFRVSKYDLEREQLLASAVVAVVPDNLSWDFRGNLLVVGGRTLQQTRACPESLLDVEKCKGPYFIQEIDVNTMKVKDWQLSLHDAPRSATVAVVMGDFVFVSSTANSRIVRIPLAARQ